MFCAVLLFLQGSLAGRAELVATIPARPQHLFNSEASGEPVAFDEQGPSSLSLIACLPPCLPACHPSPSLYNRLSCSPSLSAGFPEMHPALLAAVRAAGFSAATSIQIKAFPAVARG